MREIAQGLELCNINFIWVIRFSVGDKTSVEKTLPKDYLDKVGGRGLVVEGCDLNLEFLFILVLVVL